ncbi:MAG: hypothetical protein ACQEUZ_13215, partial [Pseudomonadota bacterium]
MADARSEITARAPRAGAATLWALGGAYFVIGSASLGAVGMVEEMRGALGVSAAAIAALVTVFALIYAV